jgi:hypothetical protein
VKGRTLVALALVLVSTVSLAAGLAAGGRLPFLSHAWDTAASAVQSAVQAELAPPGDAGAPADAAPEVAAPHKQTAPLSSAQLAAPLVHGTYVTACGAPDTMKVVVKATVKMGRAIAVNVKTDPPNAEIAACVERAAHGLQWDISPKTEHVTVSY